MNNASLLYVDTAPGSYSTPLDDDIPCLKWYVYLLYVTIVSTTCQLPIPFDVRHHLHSALSPSFLPSFLPCSFACLPTNKWTLIRLREIDMEQYASTFLTNCQSVNGKEGNLSRKRLTQLRLQVGNCYSTYTCSRHFCYDIYIVYIVS